MALYIPAGRRRRRLVLAAGAALVVGLVVGLLIGRGMAPSIDERVSSVRSAARQTAAGLRVVVLHDESGTTGGGTDLVLSRTRTELDAEIHDAVWLPAAAGQGLLADVDALRGRPNKTDAAFGQAAEALATKIEATFGT